MADGAGPHDAEKSVAETEGLASDGSAESLDSISDDTSHEEAASRSRWRRRVMLAGILIVLIAAAVVLPPLINIGRYQRRVATLMSQSLGRPVRMSSVELRLLPLPGFVLHNLSVGEDPEFGAEPVLSAETVVASIRILSLWRGNLEIDKVSVDVASLNLVRTAQGRWNLDSLMINAQPALTSHGAPALSEKAASRTSRHFPYLEATNSRVNLKIGVEKSPYSLTETDLSLWQDEPGEWRVRLRGQPVRTDLEMSLADTGELRMEASLHSAAMLREMPVKLQMEWREAQLGQLSRLLFGSDAGWRGAVTADIDVEGTADAAQTRARLRATGVRREEFAPETPLDFDANCNFRYQHSQGALHDVGCDTAIGNGHLQLKAELPGNAEPPQAKLEAKEIPLQAGLDLLRTVRSGFAPGISVKGSLNGSLTYKKAAADAKPPDARKSTHRPQAQKDLQGASAIDPLLANFTGSLTLDGAQIKGSELKEPLQLPRVTLTPAVFTAIAQSQSKTPASAGTAPTTAKSAIPESTLGLGTRFTIPLVQAVSKPGSQPDGTLVPAINVRLALGQAGYSAIIEGSASTPKVRELAYAFGLPHLDAADSFAGGSADFDFSAAGPWLASEESLTPSPSAATPTNATDLKQLKQSRSAKPASATDAILEPLPGREAVFGSLQLHHAQWKPAYLALPVDLTSATITISAAKITLTSDFAYGTLKSADKDLSKASDKASNKESDADLKQAQGKDQGESAEKGAEASSQADLDPDKNASGKVSAKAGSLKGSVVVTASTDCSTADCVPEVQLRFGAVDAAQVEAALLGAPEQRGLLSPLIDRMRSSDRPKWPEVAVTAQAESLLLGPATLQKPTVRMRLKGGEIDLEDWEAGLLDGSVKGTGHFAWAGNKPDYSLDGNFTRVNAAALGAMLNTRWAGGLLNGSGSIHLTGLTAKEFADSASGQLKFDWTHGVLSIAAQEVRFDAWSGTVAIQGGKALLDENAMLAGRRSSVVKGGLAFGGPVKLSVAPSDGKLVAHAGQAVPLPAVK